MTALACGHPYKKKLRLQFHSKPADPVYACGNRESGCMVAVGWWLVAAYKVCNHAAVLQVDILLYEHAWQDVLTLRQGRLPCA